MSRQRNVRFTPLHRKLAWGVHVYTATGLIAAGAMAVAIVEGTQQSFMRAFVLMWVATFIDATDGLMARRLKVKEAVPEFDGRRLDDLTDFLTFTFLPLLLIWRAGLLPMGTDAWLLFPLVASAYGFCQVSAKTDDGYFLGFPSYWNLIAFYLFVLQLPAEWNLAFIIGFAILTFVPARYLYSTQPGKLNFYTNVLASIWAAAVLYLMVRGLRSPSDLYSDAMHSLVVYSLAFPVYYMVTSWVITYRLSKT